MLDVFGMETLPRIFISYSRSDGRAFAEDFQRKLKSTSIHAWRDIQDMGSGDILPQVLRAIERAEHLVLILSQRALVSGWIKREWSHARWVGKMVSPVLADLTIKRRDLPPWIRREEVYDIADPERWTKLVRVLQGPGWIKRAPYMPGDLPENFVPREIEYAALRDAVLARGPDNKTVGLTTALSGAGGYGKTTLANYLCHDPDVRFEFTDGIVRVEIGKERSDVAGLVTDLIERLDPERKRPSFTDIVTASEYLGELIGESRLLLVIDDVWREAQLRPFLRGAPNCVRLVTTRVPGELPRSHVPIKVDEMRDAEAVALVSRGLPVETDPVARVRLAALAKRLENWAQALSMANRWIYGRVSLGEKLTEAIERYDERLKKRGLTGFDPKDEKQRDRAIGICIEVSLEDLDAGERALFGELAVLPEDENVPLVVIEALWAESKDFDEDETDELVRRLSDLSLLQNLDLGEKTLRLHDNMAWYLRDRAGPDGTRAAHGNMVKALSKSCDGQWEQIPKEATYAWKFLIRHLRAARQHDEADRILTDYAWLKAKLYATDAAALFGNYLPESSNKDVHLVGQAIALSVPALTGDRREFARQIYGRLGHSVSRIATALVAAAHNDIEFDPAPRWPGLTPPGPERLRLSGHGVEVTSASFSSDGGRIVTAARDGTARVWDATSGEELRVLHGHERVVMSASFSPDGGRIVTASEDGTARVWDAASGAEIRVLHGHEHVVRYASFSSDGSQVVTASIDETARVWDAGSGEELRVLRHKTFAMSASVLSASFSPDGGRIVTVFLGHTAQIWDAESGKKLRLLRGHNDELTSASFSPGGERIVTASWDRTARIWDADSGEELRVLRGHDDAVNNASLSSDGGRIVTASSDGTARVWDAASGEELRVLRGHDGAVNNASLSSDGGRIVTASSDGTARVWDTVSSDELCVLRGHKKQVNSASFSPDGGRIVTAARDRTARLWDAASGDELHVLRGHKNELTSASFSPDGGRIVTASSDQTARIWDAESGAEMRVHGQDGWVMSAAFSPDGGRIVTASSDRKARIWDAESGGEISILYGHDAEVTSASFSSDGGRIVTTSWDGTARLWDAASGRELRVLRGHYPSWVTSASFSPDGGQIVTASEDRTARIWDAMSGEELRVLHGHNCWVTSALFSPDGGWIITASRDATARIWDATSGGEITRITLEAGISALAVLGDAIALGDSLGRIHVFDAGAYLTPTRNR
jgi:WD40 repeat protein